MIIYVLSTGTYILCRWCCGMEFLVPAHQIVPDKRPQQEISLAMFGTLSEAQAADYLELMS